MKFRPARSHLGKNYYETDAYETDEITRRQSKIGRLVQDLQVPIRSAEFNDAAQHQLHFASELIGSRHRNASELELALPFPEMLYDASQLIETGVGAGAARGQQSRPFLHWHVGPHKFANAVGGK